MTPATSRLDLTAIRSRFPALAATEDGRPVAYLDGPGGSQVPDDVLDALRTYLVRDNANLGGAFRASRASDGVLEAGREAIADLVGGHPDEIAFGANMTTLNFLLAHAVTRTFEPGDEIITTWLDHDANVSPWLIVAKDRGLVVKQLDVVEGDLNLDLDELERLITPRTRLVAFTLASNATGTITDAPRIAELAHSVGALAWADAVHYAPHRRIDVAALGVDVLLCSPYKFFGPHLGCAWGRRELFEAWPADRVRPADEEPAGHRFETGTQSHEAIAAATAAVDYLASLGEGADRRAQLDDAYAQIRAHEEDLSAHALQRLSAIPGLKVYGVSDPADVAKRTATFCVTLEGHTPRALSEALGAQSIASWDGNYYALSIMQRLGLEEHGGGLRIGFLHYTTKDEVDRAIDVIEGLARERSL
ncbi:MAG TPA: cysteine desulfurase-like protein [Gaiellales bacterium]|jgi:cysteine desulfurase family protein (TIGR01976 family)